MQGKKPAQEELFYYGSLNDLVPEDDPFRRLDTLLDLDWLRSETRHLYSSEGRPSVDPVVFAKLLIIAYLEGISSERRLMRQVQVNLSYRRFLHYGLAERLPDHSSLTRSRQRLGEETIRKLFEYVLRLCADAGLISGELECVDSTFVQADASLKSMRPRLTAVEAQRFTQHLFAQEADSEEDEDEDDEPPPPRRSPNSRRTNDAFVSKTDPDSSLYRREGRKARLGYLVHYAVDRAKNIITAVRTTAARERDSGQLLPLVDQVIEQGIAVQAVAADRGYSSGEVYQGLAERGVTAFIPTPDHSPERQGRFGRDRFTYDAMNDRYLCPNSASLLPEAESNGHHRYRARPEDCLPCPLRSRCTSGKARSLKISRYEAGLAAARRLQATPAAKRAGRDRRVYSERTFAEAKDRHGLRRAHRRGQPNIAIQALLTATVLNLKRYVRAQTSAFPAAGALHLFPCARSGAYSPAVSTW